MQLPSPVKEHIWKSDRVSVGYPEIGGEAPEKNHMQYTNRQIIKQNCQ